MHYTFILDYLFYFSDDFFRSIPRRRRRRHGAADAGAVYRDAGPDHRRRRHPRPGRGARRRRRRAVDRHRLPAHQRRLDTGVRQAGRPVRPQTRIPGRHRPVHRQLGAVRAGADDVVADRVARRPGNRRRRPRFAGDDHRRRPGAGPRTGALPGRPRHRAGQRHPAGAHARRADTRPPALAVDFPDQRAGRRRRAGRHRSAAAPARTGEGGAAHRRRRRRAVHRLQHSAAVAGGAGRRGLVLAVVAQRWPGRGRPGRAGGLRARAVPRAGAVDPAAPVRRSRVRHRRRAVFSCLGRAVRGACCSRR